MIVRSPRVPERLAPPGLFRTELIAAFLRLSASRTACSTRRLDSIGATLEHHEVILHSHIFVIASDDRFRARRVGPCPRDQLLGSEGSKYASTGGRLRPGHCAVDPNRIPYGSKVVFPDAVCTAVDTGTAVVSRKAARLCGRTASQLKAIVIDRYFDTKGKADAWTNTHSEFMMLRVVPAGAHSEAVEL